MSPYHLNSFKLLQSQDLDETRQLVAGVFNDHQLQPGASSRHLDYQHRYTTVGALGFSVIGYGADVHIHTQELASFYLLQLPLRGEDRQLNRQGTTCSRAGDATVHGPEERLTMNWSADCHKLAIRIDRHALERYAGHLTGHASPLPVSFHNKVDTTQGGGLALKLAAGQLFRGVSKQPEVFKLPMVWSQFEQMLFMNLLTLQTRLQQPATQRTQQVLPKTIKMAEEYLRTHLADPITLESLAELTGASIRSLHEGFRKYFGESPMRYLKDLRMEKVREELLNNTLCKNVTDVAHHWGFTELGRFAQQYRARYGELPSETLRRVS